MGGVSHAKTTSLIDPRTLSRSEPDALVCLCYREYFTPEQKAQLEKIQTVLVDVLTIADKGGVDAGALADVVAND